MGYHPSWAAGLVSQDVIIISPRGCKESCTPPHILILDACYFHSCMTTQRCKDNAGDENSQDALPHLRRPLIGSRQFTHSSPIWQQNRYEDDDEEKFQDALPHALQRPNEGVRSVRPHSTRDLDFARARFGPMLLAQVGEGFCVHMLACTHVWDHTC